MREGAEWNKREIERRVGMKERKRERRADPPTSRTGPGDAFTYRTCNNLEKVLTMAPGSASAAVNRGKKGEKELGG